MDLINAWKMEYITILLLLLFFFFFMNMKYGVAQRDIIVGSYTRHKSYKIVVADLEVNFPVFLFIQNQH